MNWKTLLTACLTVGVISTAARAEFEAPSPGPASRSDKDDRFAGYLRTAFGYNDNVQVKPSYSPYGFVGDTESLYASVQLQASYLFDLGEHVTVTPILKVEKIWYLDDAQTVGTPGSTTDDANDYNILVVSPALQARYHFDICNKPASVGLRYDFRFEEAEIHAAGLKSHNLTADFAIALDDHWDWGVSYTYGVDEFQVVFPDATLNERDGHRSAVNTWVSYKWDRGRRKLIGNAGYLINNAEGRNFDYHAWNVGLRFQTHLIANLWGAAQVSYQKSDYDGFQPPLPGGFSRSSQDNLTTALQLMYVIDKHWSIDGYWRFAHYDAGNRAFKSTVNNFGVGVTYAF